ncbi:hypothetical protein DCE93_01290 [Agromyces badenianii]|uniref:Uncharacterized protein n=3 Tax=Agromyces badenianii TaxID=2080742 RepID=A0A2S0WT35_9MICO|nr:hypothetical protein DCE93_01290 [Agromyces badenianii]
MTVLKKFYFESESDDLLACADAAVDLGLQLLIEGEIDDEDGRFRMVGTLLSGEAETGPNSIDTWWPVPDGATLDRRVLTNSEELATVLGDPRWETNLARGYWLWIRDTEDADADFYSAAATWVIEFFDKPLAPDTNVRVFLADAELDQNVETVLTPRNRFTLWVSLSNISVDLDGWLADPVDAISSIVADDMPAMVQSEPRDWWLALRESADRLREASRRGDYEGMVPRTPAEEALLSLATRPDYVEWAMDSFELHDRSEVFGQLPNSTFDGDHDEVLPELTGDTDIEMMWVDDAPHRSDPKDAINRFLGLGDYRSSEWHVPFDRAVDSFANEQDPGDQ